jgi:hypothetical protein
MEKRINKSIETYVVEFKDNIKKKIDELQIEDKNKVNELLEYVYDYQRLSMSKDDFIKRKRIQNSIPVSNRCNARRANNEQCTRRRKNGSEYCGTHTKGTPNGFLQLGTSGECVDQKLEVTAQEIDGIVYYIDKFSNVYRTEDILNEKKNPQIIAKSEEKNGKKMIKGFMV